MAEHLPSSFLKSSLEIIEQRSNADTRATVLRAAGLQRYIAAPPPATLAPSATTEEFSLIMSATFHAVGAERARDIFVECGRNAFRQALVGDPGMGSKAAMLKFLPAGSRLKLVYDQAMRELNKVLGPVHSLRDDAQGLRIIVTPCPYCTAIQAAIPMCGFPCGFFEEISKWAMGKPYPAIETQCVAKGDPVCVISLGRSPKE